MIKKQNLVKAMKTLLEINNEEEVSNNNDYKNLLKKFTDEDNQSRKIRELESLVYGLSSKVTVLTDKVNELNEQIIHLSTINEELLYVLENGYNQQEDNDSPVRLNFKDKKFELN